MSNTTDKAVQLYNNGYNCCEAVWLAFADDLSEEERNLGLKLAGGFGGGMGAGGDCGAIAGGVLVLGRWYGRSVGQPKPLELAKLTKALYEKITTEYGHNDCRNLKPKEGDHKPTCSNYVKAVVEYTERLLDYGIEEDDDCG